MKLIFVLLFLSLSLPLAAETSTHRVHSGGQDIGYLPTSEQRAMKAALFGASTDADRAG